jgi:Flp pilus assembly protein TadD
VKPLGPPDSHHLNAAQGWIELGDARSAAEALAAVSVDGQKHPDALAVRWGLLAHQRDWRAAHAVAQTALNLMPDRPGPWIQRAYALHEMKRTQEAYDGLVPAAGTFPGEMIIPYNLACYCCQLGRRVEAMGWYERALRTGDASRIKQMALNDPDLEPMWDEIKQR